jgi:uncharacterized protein (DUF1697 family)
VAKTVSVTEAAELLEPRDTLGIPLGTGQPPGLLEALGKRKVGGATATTRNWRTVVALAEMTA